MRTPFPTTQWDCVAEAGDRDSPASVAALAELCRAYWYPVYALIRARGYSPDQAADLTQDFFGRLLEGGLLEAADQRKGRFRDLIWRDCGYFLADWHDRCRAQKRGGTKNHLSLDVVDAERRYGLEPSDRLDPQRRFERAWALDVLGRALDRLAREEEQAGRAANFGLLKRFLTAGPRVMPFAILARQMGITESAVKAAVRRLRGRYRLALREEVAGILDDPGETDVDDEILDLFAALGR
jgi:DNA-directed RNA polymerase specialized sigma24 family protein